MKGRQALRSSQFPFLVTLILVSVDLEETQILTMVVIELKSFSKTNSDFSSDNIEMQYF